MKDTMIMFCPSCGEENPDDSKFCMNCGTTLSRSFTKKKPDQSYDQTQTGPTNYEGVTNYNPNTGDTRYTQRSSNYQSTAPPSSILYICSFCIPIVGIVLFFVYNNSHKEAAQTMLVLAIINLVITVFLNIL